MFSNTPPIDSPVLFLFFSSVMGCRKNCFSVQFCEKCPRIHQAMVTLSFTKMAKITWEKAQEGRFCTPYEARFRFRQVLRMAKHGPTTSKTWQECKTLFGYVWMSLWYLTVWWWTRLRQELGSQEASSDSNSWFFGDFWQQNNMTASDRKNSNACWILLT